VKRIEKIQVIGTLGFLLVFSAGYGIWYYSDYYQPNWNEPIRQFYLENFVNDEKNNVEETTSTKSGIMDLWCLELFNEEARKTLGYLKGDFLDELVCREDMKQASDFVNNAP